MNLVKTITNIQIIIVISYLQKKLFCVLYLSDVIFHGLSRPFSDSCFFVLHETKNLELSEQQTFNRFETGNISV